MGGGFAFCVRIRAFVLMLYVLDFMRAQQRLQAVIYRRHKEFGIWKAAIGLIKSNRHPTRAAVQAGRGCGTLYTSL